MKNLFLIAAVFVGTTSLVNGQNTEEALPTFDELKIAGALRSTYRQPKPQPESDSVPEADMARFKKSVQPVLNGSCVQCHGPDTQEGNIRIDTLDADLLNGADIEWWLEILAVLNNGEMPPPDEVELKDSDRTQVVEWLSAEIQKASQVRRAAGKHSSFRRMTRYEYNYALQDILGLPYNFAKDLPPEANSEDGFQNSSEMLHMTVRQIEVYRRLARNALRRAIVIGEQPPVLHWGVSMSDAAKIEWKKQQEQLDKLAEKFKDDLAKQETELDRLKESFTRPHRNTFYKDTTAGRTARSSWAYYGAKYAFKPSNSRPQMPDSFDTVAVMPHGRNQHLIVELGDQLPDEGTMRVRVRASRASDEESLIPSLQLEFGWRASNEGRAVMRVSDEDVRVEAGPGTPSVYEWDVALGDIYPRNSVRGRSNMGDTPSPSEYIRLVNSSAGEATLQLDYVEVSAPVYDDWPPASHNRIFVDSENKNDEDIYAHQILTAFMTRAWRRSVSPAEVDRKASLLHAIRKNCDSFEEAVIEVLATVLSSPEFLYVVNENQTETTADSGNSNDAPRLSSQELATRLSLFLWSSVPDDRLLQLAESGRINDVDALNDEIDRMLRDTRSKRFSKHFVHQWLDMQLLDFLNITEHIRHFDPLLKEAMQHEPIAFFDEMIRENESVLNFIHADFTIANERLAMHYGVPNVRGNHFRRVNLEPNQRRGGLLTQAGLLAMNSAGADSHPLKRGVWLLESILNDPPPPPPPAVPEIDLADPEIAKMTLKQRIEDHRNHAACMSCHAKIDPWGIAFENYDAIGRWRNEINGQPVDSTSELFNHQTLNGMDGLKRFLLQNRQDQFVRALVYKLSTYALGRPLTFADRSAIDEITANVRQNGDGLTTTIKSIITSDLFRCR